MNGIYGYMDLVTNEIVYVGKDSHIDRDARHKDHIRDKKHDEQVINSRVQDHPGRYQYTRIIEGDFDTDALNDLEITYIAAINPKFNFTPGGDGCVLGSGEDHPMYRHDLNDDEIIDMYVNQELSLNEIAKRMNSSKKTILNRLENNNVERRSYLTHLDDDMIIDMYVNQQLSGNEIAKRLNAPSTTISRRLRENNIELRSQMKDYPRITKKGFSKGKQNYALRHNGKVIATSIDKEKLEKMRQELINTG